MFAGAKFIWAPAGGTSTPFVAGTAGSGTGQYFIDANSNPIMVRGDSAWVLITNAGITSGSTVHSDITGYLSTRATQGYNATIVAAPNGPSTGTATSGATWDGVLPFTSPGVLNSTYWQRVDYLLTTAATYGITVFLDVVYSQAVDTSGAALYGWTDAQYTTYGAAIGARYKNTPNLIWFFGNDWNQDFATSFTDVINGIRSAGAIQMATVENNLESTCRYNLFDDSSNVWGQTNATFNFVYSYNADYTGIEFAYQEPSPITVVRGDGNYDTGTEEYQIRTLVWWALSSGSRGYVFGDNNIIGWTSTSYADLTADSFGSTVLGVIWDAFGSLTGWHKLVPDTGSALVTPAAAPICRRSPPATPTRVATTTFRRPKPPTAPWPSSTCRPIRRSP